MRNGPAHGLPAVALRLWLPFACAYLLSYGIRNINAVLVPSLTAEFALSASQLGLLTSIFFLAFVVAQLPGGLMLDRFGPRRVNAILVALAGCGCLAFASASSFPGLLAARVLIGLGMAMCLMSAIKAFTQWLPLERLPLAGGLLLAVGGLGGVAATAPVEWALAFIEWRSIFIGLAAASFGVAAFLFLAAPDRREAAANDSLAHLAGGLLVIAREPRFWMLALPASAIGMVNQSMQALWIGPWLRDVAQLDRGAQIAQLVTCMFASMGGFALTGTIIDRLVRRGFDPLSIYRGHAAIAIVMLGAILALNSAAAIPLWTVYFLIGNAGMLGFMNLARLFPQSLAGRYNTAFNTLVFLAVFICQWAFGIILDRWPTVDGHYAVEGYRVALGVMVAVQIVALGVLVAMPRLPASAPTPAA